MPRRKLTTVITKPLRMAKKIVSAKRIKTRISIIIRYTSPVICYSIDSTKKSGNPQARNCGGGQEGKMGNQYGPYVMYFLSQLLQKQRAGQGGAAMQGLSERAPEAAQQGEKAKETMQVQTEGGEQQPEAALQALPGIFDADETGAVWHRQTQIALLAQFCPEGAAQAEKHGHFLIGQKGSESFVAVPGRFLRDEQPAGGATGFTLWQPIRGGAALYEDLAHLEDAVTDYLYGYWIARVNPDTLALSEV